jgi:transaldolase
VRAVAKAGVRPQRLLWASTGTKDPAASDVLYVEALAAPDTVDTMPDKTLLAFADHGRVTGAMRADDAAQREVLEKHARAGVDLDAVAAQLQADGAAAFVKSWNELMQTIAAKSRAAA